MVPVSAGIYMAASAAVLFLFRENIPSAFGMIFQDAFSFRSAAGGAVGLLASKSVQYGIARGVFSNEAGLGSLAVLNGAAEGDPGVQGQWAIFEVFFDTVVSCTLTAVVILCAMGGELPAFSGNGAELTGICFSRGLGNLGGYTVSMCVALFAFATIIAWYYMGRQAASYLGEAVGKDLVRIYTAGYLAAVFLGSLAQGAGLGGFGRAQRMYGSAEPGGAGAVIREGGPSRASREGALTARLACEGIRQEKRAPAVRDRKRHEKSTPPGAFFQQNVI